MRIAALDGSAKAGKLARYLDRLAALLRERGHDVKLFALRELDIRYCTGCWSCWWKTPGECAFAHRQAQGALSSSKGADDSEGVRAAVVNSDFTLLASPLVMGFVSALLKKMQDKLVPIIHPYIKLVRGESRHWKRYDRYPVLGLLLEVEADTDREDLELTVRMQSQFALDLRSRLAFARLVTQPVEELVSEIDCAQRLAAR